MTRLEIPTVIDVAELCCKLPLFKKHGIYSIKPAVSTLYQARSIIAHRGSQVNQRHYVEFTFQGQLSEMWRLGDFFLFPLFDIKRRKSRRLGNFAAHRAGTKRRTKRRLVAHLHSHSDKSMLPGVFHRKRWASTAPQTTVVSSVKENFLNQNSGKLRARKFKISGTCDTLCQEKVCQPCRKQRAKKIHDKEITHSTDENEC